MRFVFCCWPVTEGLHDHAKAMITRRFYNQDPGCLVMPCYLKQILFSIQKRFRERAEQYGPRRCGKGMSGLQQISRAGGVCLCSDVRVYRAYKPQWLYSHYFNGMFYSVCRQ